jgi:mRNA interferase RelE/StbE
MREREFPSKRSWAACVAKYQILFAPTAAKQLAGLDRSVQLRIAAAITKLAENPTLGKQLRGELHECRSYRVGDYRVVYLVRHKMIQVEIIRIAHRREVYR